MSDLYRQFVGSPPGKLLVRQLGLPNPAPLRRYEPGQALLDGPALLGSAPGGSLTEPARYLVESAGSQLASGPGDDESRYAALIFDASGIDASPRLDELYRFFSANLARLAPNGRAVVLGTTPAAAGTPAAAIAQRSLEGFTRSVAKEMRAGGTANLVYVEPGAENSISATLRFLLGAKSAFLSGQVIRIGTGVALPAADEEEPLAGKVALVTGASRGIGAATARVLARDGAHVVCLDLPSQGDETAQLANDIGGSSLQLDVTGQDAPKTLADYLRERHGGVDVVVHNAGITRDRTLARMQQDDWTSVIAINLTAVERLTDALREGNEPVLRRHGRVVGLSSINGIAGQRGQANYATSKAGIIGFAETYAPLLAGQAATVNAVAPGFIETAMTAAIPFAMREAGRRMNSLQQGGLPIDVAETVAWLSAPGSGGITANTIRIDGQHLLGA